MTGNSEQLDLNFHAPAEDGYAAWQWDREQALRRVAEVWGLPVGRKVRLRLRGIDKDFVGVLRLAQMPASLNRHRPLSLRMDRHVFESSEIEACSLYEG